MSDIAITGPPTQSTQHELVSRAEFDEYMLHQSSTPDQTPHFLKPETLDVTTLEPRLALDALTNIVQDRAAQLGAEPDPDFELLKESKAWQRLGGEGKEDMDESEIQELIDDPAIAKYMRASRDRLELDQLEVEKQFGDIVRLFREGFKQGRKLGYIPENVSNERIEGIFKSVAVGMFDRATAVERQTFASYTPDEGRMELMSGMSNRARAGAATHELRHAVGGGTFVKETTPDGDTVFTRKRTGFIEENKDGALKHTALEEAVVEHTRLAIMNGKWNILNPLTRKDEGFFPVRVGERAILYELLKASGGLIDLKNIVRASFEDTAPGSSFPERRKMIRQFREAYGPGSLHDYDVFTNAILENKRPDLSFKTKLAIGIRPPVFDKSHHLQETGKIRTNWIDPGTTRYASPNANA